MNNRRKEAGRVSKAVKSILTERGDSGLNMSVAALAQVIEEAGGSTRRRVRKELSSLPWRGRVEITINGKPL
ncbi:MAG: hypothetical protein ABH867_04615 [Patescibacteria group bacterium]|nr:hypothetical protein [Patescibacteria group bacterium]